MLFRSTFGSNNRRRHRRCCRFCVVRAVFLLARRPKFSPPAFRRPSCLFACTRQCRAHRCDIGRRRRRASRWRGHISRTTRSALYEQVKLEGADRPISCCASLKFYEARALVFFLFDSEKRFLFVDRSLRQRVRTRFDFCYARCRCIARAKTATSTKGARRRCRRRFRRLSRRASRSAL